MILYDCVDCDGSFHCALLLRYYYNYCDFEIVVVAVVVVAIVDDSAHPYYRLDSWVSFHDPQYTCRCHRRAHDDIVTMARKQYQTITTIQWHKYNLLSVRNNKGRDLLGTVQNLETHMLTADANNVSFVYFGTRVYSPAKSTMCIISVELKINIKPILRYIHVF